MTERSSSRVRLRAIAALALAAILTCLASAPAHAAETDVDGIPTSGAIYTLAYPDGSTVTTEGYDEAKALLAEEKLLGTFKTDAEGKILLEKYAGEGTIRIREVKAPEGYTWETQDTEADLADGEVTIVNVKEPTPGPTPEPTPKPKPAPKPAPKAAVPATGDATSAALPAVAAIGAAAALGLALKKRRSAAAAVVLAAGLAALALISPASALAEPVSEGGAFTIVKTDDGGNPLEGVEFEIYGRPTLSFEEKPTLKLIVQKRYGEESLITWMPEEVYNAFLVEPLTISVLKDGEQIAQAPASEAAPIELEVEPGTYVIKESKPVYKVTTSADVLKVLEDNGWDNPHWYPFWYMFYNNAIHELEIVVAYDKASGTWTINGEAAGSKMVAENQIWMRHLSGGDIVFEATDVPYIRPDDWPAGISDYDVNTEWSTTGDGEMTVTVYNFGRHWNK